MLSLHRPPALLAVLALALAYGPAFSALHTLLGAGASLLSVGLALCAGGLLGRRVGVTVAGLLSLLNVVLYWLLGVSPATLNGSVATALVALLVAAVAGGAQDRARRAQLQTAETGHARETLENELAQLLDSEQSLRQRTEQQGVLATMSQRALTIRELPALFEELVRRIGEALGSDSCTLWRCESGAEFTSLASHASRFAQTGEDEGLLHHARYTYWVGEPVLVADLRADPRLRGAASTGQLTSGVMVPVRSHGTPFAILGVHWRAARATASHEVSFLESAASLLSAAIDHKQVEEGLQRQALHDPLTGLANRSLFQDRLGQALQVARRDKKPLALMLMDLDRFKEVNDTLGHQAGDQLLLEVGRRLQHAERAADTVARLGGDEFAIILPGVADVATAGRLATKLLEVVERPMHLDGQSIDIGASIGVAMFPEHGDNAEDLLRRADVAMYAAKRSGIGATAYASEHDQHSRSRLALSSSLRQAIDAGELILHYQPQVEFGNSRLAGIEALLRWRHPELGLLAPDAFIPLAEEMGMIATLDRWALKTALNQARIWQDGGLEIPISVNLSMRNVVDPNLIELINDLLVTSGISPTMLELEITESSIMADPLKVRTVLAQCRALGVRIAIDDFGTGYSSLAYLKRLPVDSLKIDKSFVSEMASDKSDLAIVRSTLELGHNLGLRVVAEGIEDEITYRLLAQLRCDVGQGHYFSPALPAAAVMPWLERSRWNQPAERYAA